MHRHDLLQPATGRTARRSGRTILLEILLGAMIAVPLALPGTAHATHRSFGDTRDWSSGPFYGLHGTFFADVTGDGKADAIAVNADRVWFRRSDGCRFGPNEALTSTPFFGTRGTFFADVTGDRKADPIAVNDDGVVVRRSEDSRRFTWSTARLYGGIGIAFADVDGDNKADAIEVTSSGVVVRRSNGVDAFGPAENWTRGAAYHGARGTYFADVTGDQRADAIVVNDWGVTVRRSRKGSVEFSRPDEFNLNESWTKDPYYGSRANFFVDVTGDGRADAVVVNDDGIAVRDAIVNAFRSPAPVTHAVTDRDAPIRPWGYWTPDAFYGYRETFFADVDGDRAADAIAVNNDGVWIRRSRFANFDSECR
jgi:hypothetical protein